LSAGIQPQVGDLSPGNSYGSPATLIANHAADPIYTVRTIFLGHGSISGCDPKENQTAVRRTEA